MMPEIIVDNCPACDPVKRLIHALSQQGYNVLESKLEDYHFHQLYFKADAPMDIARKLKIGDFSEKDNYLICKCHWSRIEFSRDHFPKELSHTEFNT